MIDKKAGVVPGQAAAVEKKQPGSTSSDLVKSESKTSVSAFSAKKTPCIVKKAIIRTKPCIITEELGASGKGIMAKLGSGLKLGLSLKKIPSPPKTATE